MKPFHIFLHTNKKCLVMCQHYYFITFGLPLDYSSVYLLYNVVIVDKYIHDDLAIDGNLNEW